MPTAVEEERKQAAPRPAAEVVENFLRTVSNSQAVQEEVWKRELRRTKTATRPARDHQTFRRRSGIGAAVAQSASDRVTEPTSANPSPAIAPHGPLQEDEEPAAEPAGQTEAPTDTEEQADAEHQRNENLPAGSQQSAPADQAPAPGGDGGGKLEGVNESYNAFPNAPKSVPGGAGGKAAAAGAAGAVAGALVGGPAGAAAGAEVGAEAGGAAAGAAASSGAGAAATGAEAGAAGSTELATAQQLRSEKVAAQHQEQQKESSLRRTIGQLQQTQSAAAEIIAQAETMVNQVYKQAWQAAQEAVEDAALSMTDFFLVTGPLTVALYLLRWLGGNMMGELFTKQITAPLPPGIPNQTTLSVKVKVFPPYGLSDLQDYERHMKFLIIGAVTFILYGFIIMMLYYWTHWLDAISLAIQTGWNGIIDLLRSAYTP